MFGNYYAKVTFQEKLDKETILKYDLWLLYISQFLGSRVS